LQGEIHQYIQGVAKTHGVYDHVQFNTEFLSCQWEDKSKQWLFETAPTDNLTNVTRSSADILIISVAALNRPSIPQFPGLSTFKGQVFHTAQWDNSFTPDNKRIAVIGTGGFLSYWILILNLTES
jgi:4-hydroxyacetophenone monooxygenase